jgi:hypothetical protein
MLEKRIPLNLGGQFATLGAKQQAKDAQSWPQVLLALTPSVKGGLKFLKLLMKMDITKPFFLLSFSRAAASTKGFFFVTSIVTPDTEILMCVTSI